MKHVRNILEEILRTGDAFRNLKRNGKLTESNRDHYTENTSEEERRAIGGILGKTFYENTIRFPFAEFEKGLQYTKFAPVDFEQVLEAYFGRKMLTTQERQKEAERGKADFLKL